MDQRLAARLDPSDVVQETLIEAAKQLPDYLDERPLPFYPWLRRLALDRLEKLHIKHIRGQKRSVDREEPKPFHLSDESVQRLAKRLASSGTSPSDQLLREELRQRVAEAMAQLDEQDREILLLKFVEQLSAKQMAAILGQKEGAVRMRQLRALERLQSLLESDRDTD
jgi:RNA polymerase sigma-70 factor (ECF subfamily)